MLVRLIRLLGWLLVLPPGLTAQPADTLNTQLLYRIEGPGPGPSWLFGSMHSPSRQAFGFNVRVLREIEAVETFAGELDLNPLLVAQAQQKMLLPKGQTLDKVMSKKDYQFIARELERTTGASIEAYKRMQPIFLAAHFAGKNIRQNDLPAPMDAVLQQYAKGFGKTTFGLETPAEQLATLGSLSLKEQSRLLVEAARKAREKPESETDSLLEAYRKGQLEPFLDPARSGMPPAFFRRLVEGRNQIMAHRLDSALRRRSCFAAIGALHLPGDSGVVALLRQRGWTLTAIPLAWDGSAFVVAERFLQPVDANWYEAHAEDFGFRQWFPAPPERRQQSEGTRTAETWSYRDAETGQTYALHILDWGTPPPASAIEGYLDSLLVRYGVSNLQAETQDGKSGTRYLRRSAPEALLWTEACSRAVGNRIFVQVVQLPPAIDRRRQRAEAFLRGLHFGD